MAEHLHNFFYTNYITWKHYTQGHLPLNHIPNIDDINTQIAIIPKKYQKEIIISLREQFDNTENIKLFDKFEECDTDYLFLPPSNVTIPNEIKNPPKIRDDIIYYDTNMGYTPISKDFEYLQNFIIDYNDKSFKIPSTLSSHKKNILAGQYKMFHGQVKTRGMSAIQSLWALVLSYRCAKCRRIEERPNNCRCYLQSSVIKILCGFCASDGSMPFYINKFNEVIKDDKIPFISSVIPALWFALCELGIRITCGSLSEKLCRHVVHLWLDCSKTSFLNAILYKIKSTRKITEKMHNVGEYDVPKYDVDFNITSSSTRSNFVPLTIDEIKHHGLEKVIRPILSPISNVHARFLLFTIQHFSPSILVTGSIELLIGKSAQATQPVGAMAQKVTCSADMGFSQLVPFRFAYDDTDVNDVLGQVFQLIIDNPPELDKLESAFIEIATTNSAGLSKKEMKTRVDEIIRDYGDNEDGRMLADCAGIRLFDVIDAVNRILPNIETYRNNWNTDNSSGLRYQVDRRIRLIQMLRTVYMFGPFIIKTVLEKAILADDIASTGKTTNDIRDAYHQCVGTSIGIKCNSDDVAGMDTSTHKAQTGFISDVVCRYLETRRHEVNKFFFDVTHVEVPIEYVDNMSRRRIIKQEISVLEYLVINENYAANRPRKYYGGYFASEVYSSNITFESGTYKTSIQHTTLLSAIYRSVKQRFETKYVDIALRIEAKVLGDDQFSYIIGIGKEDNLGAISDEIKEYITALLYKFGYITDSTYEKGFGEFLKQAALHGCVSPYCMRLSFFTSERGETGGPMDKIRNMLGVLDELGSRCPIPENTTILKYNVCVILGIFGYSAIRSQKILGQKSSETRFSYVFDADIDRYIKSFPMIKVNDGDRTLFIPRGIWYCHPSIACPFPSVNGNAQGCFLTFSSPAVCRNILMLVRKDVDGLEETKLEKKYEPKDVQLVIRSISDIQKTYWLNAVRMYGSAFVAASWSANNSIVPRSIFDYVDVEKYERYGFLDAHLLINFSKLASINIEVGTGFKSLQKLGNKYLDPDKAKLSYASSSRLRDMGLQAPESLVYYNRVGARLESVVSMKGAKDRRKLETESMLKVWTVKKENIKMKAILDIGYGFYSLINMEGQSPVLPYSCYERGLGPCVRPEGTPALYVDYFGLPRLSDYDIDSVKAGIESALLVNGSSAAVLSVLSENYKKGGLTAINLTMDAFGIGGKLRNRIWQFISTLGYDTMSLPFALNPRKLYYYSTTRHPRNTINHFSPDNTLSEQLRWAFYIGEVFCHSELLGKRIGIKFGVE